MDPRVCTAVDLIKRNPNVTLRELARAVCLSPSRLQHLFVEEHSMSMRAFAQRERLSRAAYFLADTHMSVKEIRALVGFADPSSFCRAFKKRYGAAPKTFRLDARAHASRVGSSRIEIVQ